MFSSHFYRTVKTFKNNPIPTVKMGHKFIPLKLNEVQHPVVLNYDPWREILIAHKVSDFIINGICPSFAIMSDWFYVKNSKKGMFDNQSQYDKLNASEMARDIVRTLNEAQKSASFIHSAKDF